MNNNLSVTSRILVAFASGALIAVYFLPAWRIDLFAPQYPEGLTMYIWINNITGDIDIINGLNHYIGMKKISVEMFPELRFLPYIVVFFMALGMVAAITGKRKLLFIYVVLTIVGGLLIPYDLYRWGYSYGHELDPTAPIQVPGLSYQPPVIGHKRLLNFDAYSFPDIAGWIVFGAGLLVITVWVVEKYKHGFLKTINQKIPVQISTVMGFLMLLVSCSTKPEPFVAGQDECHVCKMGMADFRFGGEVITNKGKIYKFDDMRCMIDFLKSGSIEEKDIAQKLFMNYEKPNEFLKVESAWFVASKEIRSPMNSNISGFPDKSVAENILKDKTGEIVTWEEIVQRVK